MRSLILSGSELLLLLLLMVQHRKPVLLLEFLELMLTCVRASAACTRVIELVCHSQLLLKHGAHGRRVCVHILSSLCIQLWWEAISLDELLLFWRELVWRVILWHTRALAGSQRVRVEHHGQLAVMAGSGIFLSVSSPLCAVVQLGVRSTSIVFLTR